MTVALDEASDDAIQIASVSEMLALLGERDLPLVTAGLRSLVCSSLMNTGGPLYTYLQSEPVMPHFFVLLGRLGGLHGGTSSDQAVLDASVALLHLLTFAVAALARVLDDKYGAIQLARAIIGGEGCIAFIRGLLASSYNACITAALDLLSAALGADASIVGLLAGLFDFGQEALGVASRMRRPHGERRPPNVRFKVLDVYFSPSPRQAYIAFVVSLLQRASFDDLVGLARTPSFLHHVLDRLAADPYRLQEEQEEADGPALDETNPRATAEAVLRCLQQKIIFNRDNSRNLSVAFFRGGHLSSVAALLASPTVGHAQAAASFLLTACTTQGSTLIYPPASEEARGGDVPAPADLRNRIIFDLIASSDIVNSVFLQSLYFPILRALPDVAWALLECQRFAIETPAPTLAFVLSAGLLVKVLALLPAPTSLEAIAPRRFTKALLTKAMLSDSPIVQYYALLLLLTILQRARSLSPTSRGVEPAAEAGAEAGAAARCNSLAQSLPDYRTVYNVLHNGSEAPPLVRACLLRVVALYMDLGCATRDEAFATLRAADIWTAEGIAPAAAAAAADAADSIESPAQGLVVAAAMHLCKRLDVVRLLKSPADVTAIGALLRGWGGLHGRPEEARTVRSLLAGWLTTSQVVRDGAAGERVAAMCMADGTGRTLQATLQGIYAIHQEALVFPTTAPTLKGLAPTTVQPILAYLEARHGITPSLTNATGAAGDEEQASTPPASRRACALVPPGHIVETGCPASLAYAHRYSRRQGREATTGTLFRMASTLDAYRGEGGGAPLAAHGAATAFTEEDLLRIRSAVLSFESGARLFSTLLTVVPRRSVMEALARTPTTCTERLPVEAGRDIDRLLRSLLVDFDCAAWLRLMGAAFTSKHAGAIDLRLVVESGVLSFAVVGASLASEALCRCSHLILTRYRRLLAAAPEAFPEAVEVGLVLDSLAALMAAPGGSSCDGAQAGLARLSRVAAFTYAHALPIMLRADNAAFRGLVEAFLAAPAAGPREVLGRLMQGSAEQWGREAHLVATIVDDACGPSGESVRECALSTLHVVDDLAALYLAGRESVDFATLRIIERILAKASEGDGAHFGHMKAVLLAAL